MSYEQGAVLGEAVFQEIIPFIIGLYIFSKIFSNKKTDNEDNDVYVDDEDSNVD